MKKNKGHDHHHHHHDYDPEHKRLNRVKGQVEGIQKMIEDHRYCPDIIVQVRAARNALRSIETSIMEKHLRGCVTAAMKSTDHSAVETKIRELVQLFGQMKD